MPGHLIRRLNQISTAVFAERMADAGLVLTPVQFAALSTIEAFPGIDQAGVAKLIAFDRATLGKVIDRLSERELVRRMVASRDRRARELSLTDKGHTLYRKALPQVSAIQPDILGNLDADERRQFLALLEKATLPRDEPARTPQ